MLTTSSWTLTKLRAYQNPIENLDTRTGESNSLGARALNPCSGEACKGNAHSFRDYID